MAMQHETMRTVCFSSFIINKAVQWKYGQLFCVSQVDTRHYLDILLRLYSILMHLQGRYREAIILPPGKRCPSIPIRPFPICSSCLSISHLKLFGSWQFIRFSSPGQGWAIIRPHQAWRGNHSWAFFSHGVFSQWQAHWLCVGSGCVCLPSLTVELLQGVQIVTHTGVIHL